MSVMHLAEYHRHPAWSPTALKAAVTGTMRAWEYRFGPDGKAITPSLDMVRGELVDALLTPPFQIEERFMVFSTVARNSKAGAANCAEAEANGRQAISAEMLEMAQRICQTLRADPEIGEILQQLDQEHSQSPHFWSDAQGRPCRCLPDVVTLDGRLYDLKKTRCCQPRRFYWQARDLAYDLQMAHLALGHRDRHGSDPGEVGLIAFEWPTEPSGPVDCCLLVLDENDLQRGLERREEAFRRILSCQASGQWPSYGRQPFRPVASGFSVPESEAVANQDIHLF